MTRPDFDAQIVRLMVLRFPPADVNEHFSALKDIPAEVFIAAVSYALKTRRDFPVPAELRVDADHVAVDTRTIPEVESREIELAQPFTITVPEVGKVVSITREWRYYCDRCNDGGWASWWCGSEADASGQPWPHRPPWSLASQCGRHYDHDPHEWVQRCACYDSNPALQRKRAAMLKYSTGPQKVA